MEKVNEIVPGPFVDKLISKYLNLSRKKYSTNASDAFILLSKFVSQNPCGFNIDFKKQLNFQFCKVTLNTFNNDYQAEDGYLPMAICLLFINSWAKPLKHYSYEFLKLHYDKYLDIQKRIEEFGYNDIPDEDFEYELHPDIPELFRLLNEDQIRALIKYANRY
jgi:hypothetical protein